MAVGYGQPAPKPEPRARTKRRQERIQGDQDALVRVFVFGRERGICRVCRVRMAESRHELVPRSLGGKVTKRNCIAICGVIVGAAPSCHTYLQSRQIQWMQREHDGAQGPLTFTPITREAADWLKVAIGHSILSEPMAIYEEES